MVLRNNSFQTIYFSHQFTKCLVNFSESIYISETYYVLHIYIEYVFKQYYTTVIII